MARRLVMIAVLALVAGAMFWSGVHNLQKRRAQMQAQQAARIVVQKDGDDPGGNGPVSAHLRGKPAPDFTLTDLDGKKRTLAEFKGKPVILNFWATWCGPCQLEMPWFQEFSDKYKDSGLAVLGVNMDDGAPKDQIEKSLKRAGVKYPTLLGNDTISKAYGGVDYLPETFYVDRNGNVVEETAGAPGKDEIEAHFKETIAAAQ